MADEVTKKDLQSLQGWVNAELKKLNIDAVSKRIETNDQAASKMEAALIRRIDQLEKQLDAADRGARGIEGGLIKRIDQLEARVVKLEKA